jgi:long-chain acyl-CoA synthetase
LAQKPRIYDLIGAEVERVNADLEAAMQIKRYVLLHKELDADDEELTRTRKVRRGLVSQKYEDIIEALFSDATEIPVTSVITYQDGRQTMMETKLTIRSIRHSLVSA